VARRFGDESECNKPQVALRQHAARAHHVLTTHAAEVAPAAVAAAKSKTAEAVTAMAPSAPFAAAGFFRMIAMSVHFLVLQVKDISLDRSIRVITQDISYTELSN
jgi:hypothetical protein